MTPRTRTTRLLLFLVALLVGGIAVAAPAQARDSLDAVASVLRSTPVYNDPSAENALTTSQVDDLVAQIESGSTPIHIAVLPDASLADGGGTAEGVLVQLRDKVGRPGVYAVIVGNKFRAGSTSGTVRDLADQAFAENRSAGPYAVLSSFVTLTQERFDGGSTSGSPSSSSSSGGSGWVVLIVLGVLTGGVGLLIWWAVRRGKKAQAEKLAAVKKVVDEDVTQFGERLAAFDISDPRLDDAGRTDLQGALNAYDKASDLSEAMRSDADATAVTQQLEDGRYLLACVEARMDGRPLPERRPPCFVDPRHGPSTQDVEWAPAGGQPRPVPVCDSCAASLARGLTPAAREVPVGAGTAPYWQAGPQYGGYARGYYSSFGDVLPAVLVGTMFASMMMPGPTVVVDNSAASSGGDWGGGGGFGGGDWGGGGGGDFGGGDFGGGGDF